MKIWSLSIFKNYENQILDNWIIEEVNNGRACLVNHRVLGRVHNINYIFILNFKLYFIQFFFSWCSIPALPYYRQNDINGKQLSSVWINQM